MSWVGKVQKNKVRIAVRNSESCAKKTAMTRGRVAEKSLGLLTAPARIPSMVEPAMAAAMPAGRVGYHASATCKVAANVIKFSLDIPGILWRSHAFVVIGCKMKTTIEEAWWTRKVNRRRPLFRLPSIARKNLMGFAGFQGNMHRGCQCCVFYFSWSVCWWPARAWPRAFRRALSIRCRFSL